MLLGCAQGPAHRLDAPESAADGVAEHLPGSVVIGDEIRAAEEVLQMEGQNQL